MAHAPSIAAPRAVLAPAADKPAPARFWRNTLRRLCQALIVSRRRQVDREIERYLNSVGGMLTDHAEREIERRFLGDRTH